MGYKLACLLVYATELNGKKLKIQSYFILLKWLVMKCYCDSYTYIFKNEMNSPKKNQEQVENVFLFG